MGGEQLRPPTGRPVRVILVTDGDNVAQQALQLAAVQLGLRCISMSGGNPTQLTGEEIVSYIVQAEYDPVLVMVDDRGHPGLGKGEKAALVIGRHPAVELLGVIAVASHTDLAQGVEVDASIDQNGNVVPMPVNKDGVPERHRHLLKGDTVDVLGKLKPPIVVGVGDIGKMQGHDSARKGVPVTLRAIETILAHHGIPPLTDAAEALRAEMQRRGSLGDQPLT